MVLQRYWDAIRDAFKYYSTPGPSPFNVGLLSWTQFCQDSHLVEAHACSLNDVDRIFMASNVLSKDVKFYRKEKSRIPDRQLVRHRALQWLVARVDGALAIADCPCHSVGSCRLGSSSWKPL